MNRLLKAYLMLGLFLMLTVYLLALNWWLGSTLSGLHSGAYSVTFTIYTNSFGEDYVELALLVLGFPAAIGVFALTLMTLSKKEREEKARQSDRAKKLRELEPRLHSG